MMTFLIGFAGGAAGVLVAAALVLFALWLRTRLLHRRGLAPSAPETGPDEQPSSPTPVWPGGDTPPTDPATPAEHRQHPHLTDSGANYKEKQG